MPALVVVAACSVALGATAATPVAAATADDTASAPREASRAWSPFFESLRPVGSIDARRVIVVFDDPSLGAWVAAGERTLNDVQRAAWVKQAIELQQRRLDAMAIAGVQFRVEHRYVRVVNGASIVVHGDGAQLLRSIRGVKLVTPVRTMWPAAGAAAGPARSDDGAAGAAAAVGAPGPVTAAAGTDEVRVAVLDAGVDPSHPAVAGHVDAPLDATRADGTRGRVQVVPAAHGTAVAGSVVRAAGDDAAVRLMPIRILEARPARDGVESLFGDSDDLLAGLERAVDPNRDGRTADAAHVALIASTAPFAGFTGSPEDLAVQGADALGTLVVAAAGNDGASGDAVGTIGSIAASDAALAVGAVDLRGRTPAADVRVRGGGIDETFEAAPVLTASDRVELPDGALRVVVVEQPGDEAADYLDAELRSRVSGAVALVATRDGVTIAEQVRAAADAGAIAVLVGADDADPAAGTIDVRGADIPAIGIARDDARALRDAIASGERLALTLRATTERNPAFGTVAGFSSGGPRLDGIGRPDVVAPGVGMLVAGADGGWEITSGTSIAAAWAAGEAARVREAHPDWEPATVRAAIVGSARVLGTIGDRPKVELQGGGLIDATRASTARWHLAGGRIDAGSVAPGFQARIPLDLVSLAPGATIDDDLKILLDDGGRGSKVTPKLVGSDLVLSVAVDAPDGHVGGWLVLPDHELRIPWSITVRDAQELSTPIRATVTNRTLQPVAGPGAFASTLTIGIGGDAAGSALGIGAVQRLDVRLIDSAGKDRGAIGGLDQALPGIYTFGLTGVDARGDRLRAGAWQLQVRYIPAGDPTGEWRTGPVTTIAVKAAPRARDAR